MEGKRTLLKIRVINRFDAGNSEVTADLSHLHQSTWTTVAFQPGNPGSTALGAFTIPLHPPGSAGFKAAKPIYDSLRRYQRVEAYDGGKLRFAGIIDGIRKIYGETSSYELTGFSDVYLANKSRPFAGEMLANAVTSSQLKSYLGTNEIGASDAFNPFTSANYNSVGQPGGGTSGTWSGTTDDGLNVVSCATGSGANLISKTGAAANDLWHQQFVTATGRLSPSTDATNAGTTGLGISSSNSTMNDSVVGYITAQKINGRYTVNASIAVFIGGALTTSTTVNNVLINADDPQGMIPFTISLLCTNNGVGVTFGSATLAINGRPVIVEFPTAYDPGTSTRYPLLHYGNPATGTATTYLTNLSQYTRFTPDGPSTASAFGLGTITAASHSLAYNTDPGPTILEAWSRFATREGWYWRYTPQPYVVGTRTLGTVDFQSDPGTDRTASVIFRRDQGNLISLEFNNNADPLATDTALTGQSTPDGGGSGFWIDIASTATYGVIQDEALSFTHSDFNTLRRAALQVSKNKINLDTLGAKTAVVLRDPRYADVYRELDKITIHDPEMGCNYLACRIMARTFTENNPTETLILDQFAEDFLA